MLEVATPINLLATAPYVIIDGKRMPFVIVRYEGTEPGEPEQRELCYLEEGTLKPVTPSPRGWIAAFYFDLFGNPARVMSNSAKETLNSTGDYARTIGKSKVNYMLLREGVDDPVDIFDSCVATTTAHKEWAAKQEKKEEEKELEKLREENRKLRDENRRLEENIQELKSLPRSSIKAAIKAAIKNW